VEAESVAYMVCAALGVDSTGYSLPYVASWSGGDLDKVTATADRVIRCAHQVIAHLEADRHLEHDRSRRITTGRQEPGRVSLPTTDTLEAARVTVAEAQGALRSAISFYQDQLGQHDQARAFLEQRGVNNESVDRWELGYAPASWDSLVKALRRQHIPDEILLETGLAGRARTGRLYDRMRGRVVFPIFGAQGSPRGFAGRLIAGDGPKYLNSPETPLYKKSTVLYGLHLAEPTITNSHRAVIVEGYTDAIAAHRAGITNAVAIGGTALTPQQLDILRPLASTVTLAFDGDDAGLQAAQRVADLPRTTLQGIKMEVARLPAGNDPASLVTDDNASLLRHTVANSTPLLHHLIDRIVSRHNLDEPEAIARALYAAGPLVAHLTDTSERAEAVSYLAERVQRGEAVVQAALADHAYTRRRERERTAGRSLR
jgi:DNA primase